MMMMIIIIINIGSIALDGPWPPRDEKYEDEIM